MRIWRMFNGIHFFKFEKSIFIGYEWKIYFILTKKLKLGISNLFFCYQLAGIPEMYSWLKID